MGFRNIKEKLENEIKFRGGGSGGGGGSEDSPFCRNKKITEAE